MLHEAHLKVENLSIGQATYKEKVEAMVALSKTELERRVIVMQGLRKTRSELDEIHQCLKAWL